MVMMMMITQNNKNIINLEEFETIYFSYLLLFKSKKASQLLKKHRITQRDGRDEGGVVYLNTFKPRMRKNTTKRESKLRFHL